MIYANQKCSVLLVLAMVACASSFIKRGSLRPSPPPKGMEGRVVGGVLSRKNQFPYLIAISDSDGIICGGSLITESRVLTAVHCFLNSRTEKMSDDWRRMRVTAGEHNLKLQGDSLKQTVGIKRVVLHKDYKITDFVNDIALLEMNSPFNLTAAVKIVKLATRLTKYQLKDCTVAGWGYTHAVTEADSDAGLPVPNPFPDTPSFVQLDIIRKDECTKTDKTPETAHPSVLCAGKLAGGVGTCYGDSGGPLTCTSDTSGEPVQVGVVASGAGCAQVNSPGLFTDVAFMEPWLLKAYKALDESKNDIIRV